MPEPTVVMPRVEAHLATVPPDPFLGPGVQWWVSHAGRVLTAGAAGVGFPGRDLGVDALFPLFCATRPVMSVAMAKLVEDYDIDIEAPLRNWLSHPVLEHYEIRLADVLSHTAGLSAPDALTAVLTPPALRSGLVAGLAPSAGWDSSKLSDYSEWTSGVLCELLIGELTEQRPSEWLHTKLLAPLGTDEVSFGPAADPQAGEDTKVGLTDRIACYWGNEGSGPAVPGLWFSTPHFVAELGPALGGLGSMRSLGLFLTCVVEHLGGSCIHASLPSPKFLARWLSWRRPPRWDRVLERNCAFGLGVMVDLESHGFGTRPSASSFAHTGWCGRCLAFADPRDRLVAAVAVTGTGGGEEVIRRWRIEFIDALYEDLAEAGPWGT
ncbi:MAG: hypothetical protein JJLCMIEE_00001 [Acidimicrobiales bacterium]|nr:MAG: class A beta-lactamase-related serine hydrolase [Actinomycetota bacterium]MBV6506964.1 hypothetical protein [Acidimicrobiales bacterium]RIK05777.1 MAG: hypothetical protein DCC48_08905 [Acidobacteriota bacterium]